MSLEIFIEGYRVGNKWGWRMMRSTGDLVAFNEGHKTKKAAVAAGKAVATGFYHYPEAEIIELTRVHAKEDA